MSRAVLEAAGSIFTNKYAEGYPGRRYYGGCEWVDVVEQTAIDRAKALFGAEHANVQPHSGTQANMAVYFTLLKPGDTVLGMNLSHGGHLTHGHALNFSGRLFNIVPYGVRQEDERLDYDALDRLADEHKPKMIIVGASAYPRVFDFARVRAAADRVGAAMMTDMAHIAGLVAAGVHPSPIPHSDFVTTTTHKTLRGPRAGMVLCRGSVREGSRPERVSRTAGRPARPHHRRQGGLLQGSGRADLCGVPATDRGEREAAGLGALGVWTASRQRRHRQPSDAGGRVFQGHHRASWPRAPSARPESRSTRTRSRSIRIRPWWRAEFASARRL